MEPLNNHNFSVKNKMKNFVESLLSYSPYCFFLNLCNCSGFFFFLSFATVSALILAKCGGTLTVLQNCISAVVKNNGKFDIFPYKLWEGWGVGGRG
jgi:hypothetical protein